jgi:hypothetical protein
MALTITYTIVPFLRGAGGRLYPGAPRRSASRDDAIEAADHLVPFYAGVIVLKERSDAAQGLFLEPLLTCVIGDVPSDLLTNFAAKDHPSRTPSPPPSGGGQRPWTGPLNLELQS